jgi:hypothetical protein
LRTQRNLSDSETFVLGTQDSGYLLASNIGTIGIKAQSVEAPTQGLTLHMLELCNEHAESTAQAYLRRSVSSSDDKVEDNVAQVVVSELSIVRF